MRLHGLLLGLALLLSGPAHARVELPLLFSDGAVLQRDRPLPVWGWASPGAKIQVDFDGRSATATAAVDGSWRVELPAHAAGGPYALQVRGDGGTITVQDVLVGDVWLASGQSNMEWPLLQTDGAQAEMARADDPQIRHFKVPTSWSEKPEARLVGGQWQAATPQTVGEFSAVGYYFARELRAATGVPIGIINSSWGGSSIEAWMDAGMLELDAAALAEKLRKKREADAAVEQRTRALLARWQAQPPVAPSAWAAHELDESDWAEVKAPGAWESQGYAGMDGVAWYRTAFELTAREIGGELVLGLGQIDDSDRVWVNGQPVGGMEMSWNVARVYRVPASVLRAGLNTIAVRVTDTGGGGGITGGADLLYVEPAGGKRRSLAGDWKFRTAEATVSLQGDKNQTDTLLYNQMIRPLEPYPLSGVIWYQGESNAYPGGNERYRQQFAAMIRGWRGQWRQPELPFLWVQLANWISGSDRVEAGHVIESPWSVLRESQTATLSLPATAQAVTIDVGDANDIHPRDKRTVGHRLALAARHVAYGEKLVHSGPVYRVMTVQDHRAVLSFDLHGSALAVRGGGETAQGFEIAGADRVFHSAQARIVGDTVVAHSPKVPQPVAVRYAWRDNPEDADLTNREGLPASPFRTTAW